MASNRPSWIGKPGESGVPFMICLADDTARWCHVVLAGGSGEVVRIGHLAAAFHQKISLHNPCGPLMDAHSAHVAAAVPQLHSLERQFRETELYDELVIRDYDISDGQIRLTDGPGLGLDVRWERPEISCVFTEAIEF